jgi:hypothetical protein
MDTLNQIIYEQNKDFLQKIADGQYVDEDQKQHFIQTYLKRNFSFISQKTKDMFPKYEKTVSRLTKK